MFAHHINQQVYQEYSSLLQPSHNYDYFLHHSQLQPKQSRWANSFFVAFPCISYYFPSAILAFILMILLFLSVLDYCYYLTDIRYIVTLFVLVLAYEPIMPHIDSLLGCLLFFICLQYGSQWCCKKEVFGVGDSLVIISISPLFSVESMLQLILFACLSGCIYYFAYKAIIKHSLTKLPFIPFLTFSTFVQIIDKIYL
ncbi:prepilin peptidase [Actinobacillus vicugnae]|uniref:prepilin peptidase n=1 Tax=Actinobacillus vicugnae TaxID=2573093 RepID=UPI001FCC68A2|nr:prepilin peptidase [Actinobacillus vicugnae]